MLSDQGKCSALLTREGFFDFNIFRTHCNVSHNVTVVCQHDQKANTVFANSMSDIQISTADGFYSLQLFSSCNSGWFLVDNVCINFYHCPRCYNNIDAHEQCSKYGGQLAYHILNNVTINTPGNLLAKHTKLALFFDMFHQESDFDDKYYDDEHLFTPLLKYIFAVNGSAMCVNLNTSDPCFDKDIALFVWYRDVSEYSNSLWVHDRLFNSSVHRADHRMWAAIWQTGYNHAKKKDFALCEKSVDHSRMLTKCSDQYIVCDDGTCVHDSLVCDGHPHCMHGEDEGDCQHICSDHSHKCMSQCHHRNLCSCSPQYFQCLSGGCVPLQKICDRTVHCFDASDEPATCVYLQPEQLGRTSVYLGINSYINTLIQKSMAVQSMCSYSNVVLLNHTYYKIYAKEPTCVPLTHSSDIRFLCNLCNTYDRVPPQFFSLDRVCIYDNDCDDNYTSHCFNGYHLLKCEHTYCVERFKCPSSYCISFDHICNKVCDCPHCEDESICSKLLCPGMLLIPHMESGLRCSKNVAALKYSMNMRQVIHRKGMNITDEVPVFLHLENVVNLTSLIATPEIIVYCKILHSSLGVTDVQLFQHMVSVRRLLLPHNGIQKVHDSMFASMSQLMMLDLSYNFITHVSQVILCSLQNLQYFSLHHNLITSLQIAIFLYNPEIQVLLLESNNFSPQSVRVDVSLPSLYRLSSDIPRLCCAFNKIDFCSPPFPLFVSCSNLITSKVLIVLGWLIGLATSILSLCCLILLTYKCFFTDNQKSSIVVLLSMNLSLAELVTSFCLLSYSVINAVFSGVFGVIADQWRYSWKCLSLEGLFSVSSRSSLAFADCLSVHFAIHVPSIIRRESNHKAACFQILITWVFVTSACIAVQILKYMHDIDPYNYFCFPFTTLFPSDPLLLGLQIVTLLFDSLLVVVSIVSYSYLLVFTIKRGRNQALQSVSKRKQKLEKFAARLTVLILSTVLTWIPILCMQIVILLQITISPSIYLACILVSFSVNLILDPILLIRNALA